MRGIYIIRHLVRDPHEPFGFVLWDWMRAQRDEMPDTLVCENVCVWQTKAKEMKCFS